MQTFVFSPDEKAPSNLGALFLLDCFERVPGRLAVAQAIHPRVPVTDSWRMVVRISVSRPNIPRPVIGPWRRIDPPWPHISANHDRPANSGCDYHARMS